MCTVSTHILRLPSSLFSPTAIDENWGRRLRRRLWDLIILSSTMLPVSLATRPITVRSPVFTTIPVQVPAYMCVHVSIHQNSYQSADARLDNTNQMHKWSGTFDCTGGEEGHVLALQGVRVAGVLWARLWVTLSCQRAVVNLNNTRRKWKVKISSCERIEPRASWLELSVLWSLSYNYLHLEKIFGAKRLGIAKYLCYSNWWSPSFCSWN